MENKNLQTSRAQKWTKNIIKLKERNIFKRIIKMKYTLRKIFRIIWSLYNSERNDLLGR